MVLFFDIQAHARLVSFTDNTATNLHAICHVQGKNKQHNAYQEGLSQIRKDGVEFLVELYPSEARLEPSDCY